jgi:hypothetical protein
MSVDFDQLRTLREDYIEALKRESEPLAAVSAYALAGGTDRQDLQRMQADLQTAYDTTTRAGKAWNERIAQTLPKDE